MKIAEAVKEICKKSDRNRISGGSYDRNGCCR